MSEEKDRPDGYPETPELDKMKEISETSQKIGEFLDWAEEEKGLHLCKLYDEDREYHPVLTSKEVLLAAFLKIDLKKVENERRAVLEHIRSEQGGNRD